MSGEETPSLRWVALPQSTTLRIGTGSWRPATARVHAEDPSLAREAERLASELADAGIRSGDDAVIRLRLSDATEQAESFAIDVGDDILIAASTAAGVFRASRQLLHNLRGQGRVPHGAVHSTPAVAERGVHLDAARKHFPAEWIRSLLRTCADIGINTVQWHLSENEGFRVGSAAFPEIVSEQHITRSEAREIAELAHELHIDLIPSLDMPGHLRHILAQHPEFRMPESAGPNSECALDITTPGAVDFALALIDDIAPLFPHSTRWHLGADEFVDFARIDDYPTLREAAKQRFGPSASGFDLLTAFTNRIAAHLRGRGLAPRVWNDGMLRGSMTALDPDITLTWWTNWHADMRPLRAGLDAGHPIVNFNDTLLYHVLGENAGYTYPTSARIWDAAWHPGLFPTLPDGTRQEVPPPYPRQLRGASFSIWSDRPDAQTAEQVNSHIRGALRAMAERAWNAGSTLTHAEFIDLDERIGEPADAAGFH